MGDAQDVMHPILEEKLQHASIRCCILGGWIKGEGV